MEKIDSKYIESAMKHNGNIFIKYGHFETRTVWKEEKTPLKFLPFIKVRKKQKLVEEGKDLIVEEKDILDLRCMEKSLPQPLQKILDEVPYNKILPLDKEVYGEGLYVTVSKGDVHDILTEGGVVIGRFDMKDKGYYSPSFKNALLPKEASESMDKHQSCEPVSIEDAVLTYCTEHSEAVKHIPEALLDKSESLESEIKNIISKEKVTLSLDK